MFTNSFYPLPCTSFLAITDDLMCWVYTAPITSMAISPNGTFLAGASRDNLVRVWGMDSSGGVIRTLKGHAGEI